MKKILLAILPYWDPMIPPMGITSLKSFLQKHGYIVKTVDLIVKKESLDFYYDYFRILEEFIPFEKQGNFRNIGHDVLQNHMMAHINHGHDEEKNYVELVKLLVYHHYYVELDSNQALELINIVDVFYKMLHQCFLELLEQEKPDVVGVTAYKCTIPASLFVLNLTKKYNPNIKTLMGGGAFNESYAPDSPSFDMLLDISKDYLDKVILGQGEFLLLKYLQGKLPANQRVYTKNDLNGQIPQFNELDIPDFSDLDLSVYPCMCATSSASCIYECSFCVAKKISGNYRKKDPKLVVEEMKKMYQLHGHQLFFMTDSLINPVINDLAKEFINSDIALYYDAYFKVDNPSADVNNTLLWRQGGLYRVRLGTESGSPKVLDAMNKMITPEQIKKSVRGLAYAGIKVTTYWVIGHPGESEEDFQMTLDLIEELKDDIFQAECNYFLYHYSKQASEHEWAHYRRPLYPDWATKILNFKHWTLDLYPEREETFKRVHRFEAHCRKVGIPNPYSIKEYYEADKRWERLHKNAVPSMVAFKNFGNYIDECKKIQLVSLAKESANEQIAEFNF